MIKIVCFALLFGGVLAFPGGGGGKSHLFYEKNINNVFIGSVTYTAGAPIPGAVVLPHGVNAGTWHVSRVDVATPVFGTVMATSPLGGHGHY